MLVKSALAALAAGAAFALIPVAPAHAWGPCDWTGCYGPGPFYGPGYYGPGYYGPGYYGPSRYVGCSVPFNDCPLPAGRVCGPCP